MLAIVTKRARQLEVLWPIRSPSRERRDMVDVVSAFERDRAVGAAPALSDKKHFDVGGGKNTFCFKFSRSAIGFRGFDALRVVGAPSIHGGSGPIGVLGAPLFGGRSGDISIGFSPFVHLRLNAIRVGLGPLGAVRQNLFSVLRSRLGCDFLPSLGVLRPPLGMIRAKMSTLRGKLLSVYGVISHVERSLVQVIRDAVAPGPGGGVSHYRVVGPYQQGVTN